MIAEPWIMKHRPRRLDEMVGQAHIVTSIKNLLININEFPHLLLWGPPGTGKTTLAKVLASEIFGPSWRRPVLVINASSETQIDVVRNKITDHCRTSSSVHNVDRKMIILEEFDGFGKKGQKALREPMEEYADNVLMLMTCNFPEQIILPLRSRCSLMHFRKPNIVEISEYVARVAAAEKVSIDDDIIGLIAKAANGDFRPAINILQTAVQYNDDGRFVSEERVVEVANIITSDVVDELMENINNSNVEDAIRMVDSLMASGIQPETILNELYEYNSEKELFDINKKKGLLALQIFNDTSESLVSSVIPAITMTYFISRFCKIRKE